MLTLCRRNGNEADAGSANSTSKALIVGQFSDYSVPYPQTSPQKGRACGRRGQRFIRGQWQ
jgi:hypothetical protein